MQGFGGFANCREMSIAAVSISGIMRLHSHLLVFLVDTGNALQVLWEVVVLRHQDPSANTPPEVPKS